MDDTGAVGRIEDPELFETIQNDKSYISNVMTSSDDMIIAIPLHYDDQIVGALWGYLSISSIAESIEMDKEMHPATSRLWTITETTSATLETSMPLPRI